MIFTSEYLITDKDGILSEVAKEANNLYNAGLDNAFTCVTNAAKKPLIINGKGIKSVNQYLFKIF